MGNSFKTVKNMARAMSSRFGVAYVNYNKKCGYYVTSCSTSNTIGSFSKAGRFKVWF